MTSVEAITVADPPFVDLYIDGLPTGTGRVEVTRTFRQSAGRVRGDSWAAVVGDSVRLIDWGVPVSATREEVSYVVQPVAANGAALGGPGITSVDAPAIDARMVWVSDPHNPMGAALVRLLAEPERPKWSARVEVITTLTGRPLAISGERSARTRGWHVCSTSAEVIAAMDRVIESGVLLVRGDPTVLDHETGALFSTAPDVTRWRPEPGEPFVTYAWSGVESRGPMAPPVVSRRTYQDDLDEDPTYGASKAAYPTYLDRARAGL